MARGGTITLLDPSAEDVAEEHALAKRLASLEGATVGLVDNTKRNSDLFLQETGDLLRERFGVSNLVYARKANASSPSPTDVLDQLSSRTDAVIHAVAD